MKRFSFRHYLAHLDTLNGTLRRQVIAALQRPDPGGTVPHQVRERERRLERDRACIHCGSKGARRHGRTSGLMRFRCLADDCGKTYTALSNTGLANLRQRTTLQEAANWCDINYRTAFLWQHRFLAEMRARAPLRGVVEMDETFFAESVKADRGSRTFRPPRKRGGLKGKRGLSHAQRPVTTAAARGSETYTWHSFATGALPVTITMQSWTTSDAVIVTDAHRSDAAATCSLEPDFIRDHMQQKQLLNT